MCSHKGEFIVQVKTIVGFKQDEHGYDEVDELYDVIRNRGGQYEYDVSSMCICPKCDYNGKLFQFGW